MQLQNWCNCAAARFLFLRCITKFAVMPDKQISYRRKVDERERKKIETNYDGMLAFSFRRCNSIPECASL